MPADPLPPTETVETEEMLEVACGARGVCARGDDARPHVWQVEYAGTGALIRCPGGTR